jgi:predicted HTH domain antitoxin
VAREFGVSVDAALIRAKVLFSLREPDVEAMRDEWRQMACVAEDRGQDDPPELPERFRALALIALTKGEMSTGRYAEYTGTSRHKAMDLLRKREVHGEEARTPPPA